MLLIEKEVLLKEKLKKNCKSEDKTSSKNLPIRNGGKPYQKKNTMQHGNPIPI